MRLFKLFGSIGSTIVSSMSDLRKNVLKLLMMEGVPLEWRLDLVRAISLRKCRFNMKDRDRPLLVCN